MKKELFILIDYVDMDSTDLLKLENCDRLAMTPDAMLSFEEKKIGYLTFEDLYNYKQFREDNLAFIAATEELFSSLDIKSKPFLDFPRLFTGNIYLFSIFFTDFFYLFMVSAKIADLYDKVYFRASTVYKDVFDNSLDLLTTDLDLINFSGRQRDKIKMLKYFLISRNINIADIRCGNNNRANKLSRLDINRYRTIYLLKIKRIPEKLISFLRKIFSGNLRRKNGVVFVVRDYYEVSLLKKNMPEFLYINSIDVLFKMPKGAADANTLGAFFKDDKEIKKFAEKWFPRYGEYISELFIHYYDNIFRTFGHLLKNCKELFSRYEPSALFYSFGAITIYEHLFAYFANLMNIPIFSFQHNATAVYVDYPYTKFIDKDVNRIDVIHSSFEKELLPPRTRSLTQALGSIKLYNLYEAHKKASLPKGMQKRILYCPSPFSFCGGYACLSVSIPDCRLHGVYKDVIDACDRLGLKMDIKVHPCAEEYNYEYFKKLLRASKNNRARILTGFAVEEIIGDYGLLILDHAGTALISVAIALDMPAVLYLKDSSHVRKEVMPDIIERFYLTENKGGLEEYLNLYIRGKLNSKFSLRIIDKYIFPVESGDPRIRIPDYIRSYLENSKIE